MLRGFSGDAAAIEPVFNEPHHHSYQTEALTNPSKIEAANINM
jgi:hypothetical protein